MGTEKYNAFISNGEELSVSAVKNVIDIEPHDQIIVSSECSCTYSEHMNNCEIVNAILGVKGKNSKIFRYIVEMAFCNECGAYYIPRKSFDRLRKNGIIDHEIKGGIILYELIDNGPDFLEEKKQLSLIQKGLKDKLSRIGKPRPIKELIDEASTGIYSFQTLKEENDAIIGARKEIEQQLRSPYQGRMDVGDDNNSTTYYIGGVVDKTLGGVLIHSSWSEIGQLFYDRDNPRGYLFGKQCEVSLRRKIRIVKSELQNIENVFSNKTIYAEKGIVDKFLIQVLMSRKKSHQLTDIIATIQKEQKEIIEKAFAANIIVQGCAGSGKTMVLLHRLSYWLYNNKSLDPQRIKILTPNENFNIHINNLHSQLNLDDIEVLSIPQYYGFLLSKYSKEIASVSNVADEENVEERFVNYIYSKQFIKQFTKNYHDVVMEYTTPEEIEFISSCAQNCKVDFKYASYKSDGDLLVALASKVRSIYSINKTAEAKNIRIQNQLDKNHEINKTNHAEILAIRDRITKFENEYKTELLSVIEQEKNTLHEKEEEYTKMIQEVKKSPKISDSLAYFYEKKTECLESELEYERLIGNINNSKSIEDMVSLLNKYDNAPSILENYINEYKKQKYLYNEKLALIRMNEDTNKEAEKEIIVEHLSNEESERLKGIINKIPSDIIMYLFNKVFDMTIAEKLKELDMVRPNNVFRYELYARLVFSALFWDKTVGEDDIICIDEGQDVSYYEYELIIQQNKKNNTYYSIYGDLNQRIKMGRGLSSWEQIEQTLIATKYTLQENYRNTNQVTRYCNDTFDFANMIETGVDGEPVRHISFTEMLEEIKHNLVPDGITAILLPRKISKQRVTRSNIFKGIEDLNEYLSTKYDITKISIMYVDEIKGIEFNKVYVFEDGMEINEKYISFTRSLDQLIIVNQVEGI